MAEFIAHPGELFFLGEQRLARLDPRVMGHDLVICHPLPLAKPRPKGHREGTDEPFPMALIAMIIQARLRIQGGDDRL